MLKEEEKPPVDLTDCSSEDFWVCANHILFISAYIESNTGYEDQASAFAQRLPETLMLNKFLGKEWEEDTKEYILADDLRYILSCLDLQ